MQPGFDAMSRFADCIDDIVYIVLATDLTVINKSMNWNRTAQNQDELKQVPRCRCVQFCFNVISMSRCVKFCNAEALAPRNAHYCVQIRLHGIMKNAYV
jgi:hypothetical protein